MKGQNLLLNVILISLFILFQSCEEKNDIIKQKKTYQYFDWEKKRLGCYCVHNYDKNGKLFEIIHLNGFDTTQIDHIHKFKTVNENLQIEYRVNLKKDTLQLFYNEFIDDKLITRSHMSKVSNFKDTISTHYYFYNPRGDLIHEFRIQKDEDHPFYKRKWHERKYKYWYSNDNILSKKSILNYKSDGSIDFRGGTTQYYYNDNNISFTKSYGSDSTKYWTCKYTYSNTSLVLKCHINANNVFSHGELYKYNNQGKLDRIIFYSNTDSFIRERYSYDERLRLKTKSEFQRSSSLWSETTLKVEYYEYW